MKIRFLLNHLVALLCWCDASRASANILVNPQIPDRIIRISTSHFAPYMYQDKNSNFMNHGMEFQLLQTLAQMLNVSLYVRTTSNHSDICDSVARNVSDVCVGGIFPMQNSLDNAVMSVYATDELTWCVRKSEAMPMFLSSMLLMQPPVWFLLIFGNAYMSGYVLYLLIQFDRKYEQRNNRDWHQITWLATLPAIIGFSPQFRPIGGFTRLFFGMILVTGFFVFQVTFTSLHDFLLIQIPWHQVATFNEIMEMDYQLIGPLDAFHVLNRSAMIPNPKIESFQICEDVNECLEQLLHQENVAIAGSRQNILNSPLYSPSQVFCFKDLENIAYYPIALYVQNDFHLRDKVNTMIQRLFEAGFFVKWKSDAQLKVKYEPQSHTLPMPLRVAQIGAPLVFALACGSFLSTVVFIAEHIVSSKMKQERKYQIWIYLEQFFDGKRHYLTNLPERLAMQNKHSTTRLSYLD